MGRYKNKKPGIIRVLSVDRLGFEPRLTEPKSAVLPLHNRSIIFLQKQRKDMPNMNIYK